jgi:hypothetical protein
MQLAEVAVAAGFAGQSVTLGLDGYPAPLLCGMCRTLSDGLGHDHVIHVHGRSHLQVLMKCSRQFRLVTLHNAKLLSELNWFLQTGRQSDASPLPAVILTTLPEDLDQDPGATLVLHANDLETERLTQSLSVTDGQRDWALTDSMDTETVAGPLPMIARACSSNVLSMLHDVRDRKIVHGLIAGASLLETARADNPGRCVADIATSAYARVRDLLQSVVVSSSGSPVDRLATAMVSRSNVYVAVKCGPDQSEKNPFAGHPPPVRSRPPRNSELITQREVVDLGNITSRTVRQLIEYLQQSEEGYEQFLQLGLARRSPARRQWKEQASGSLAALLDSWTAKQVRTRFDRLRQRGLMTAERISPNGAFRYVLPESLSSDSNRFSVLPPPDEWARQLVAG